ncbi:transposase [Marinomonas polaris]|uniref:transposase n=1 Tax=Marinomonas polaris TaxID=293552 RepID=UPI001C31B317|nr:transposase [Marinomonas polaris]
MNKILPIVSPNMHKTRRNALSVCVLSLAQGNLCTVTSIGRGIQSKAYEKHRIKRSDRLLSNPNLRREALSIYAYICRLFVIQTRPIISVDWSDLDARGQHLELKHRQSNPITNQFVLYKSSPKGRHSINQKGKRRTSLSSLTAARGAKEPWLLVSSLPVNRLYAKHCVKAYETRMQIEEGFRDIKSSRFGLGFELSYTFKIQRLSNLMLLTTLTALLLVLVGKVIELAGYANRFQANTLRKRRVLSRFYLGKRAVMTRFQISKQDWRNGIRQLVQQLSKGV